MHNPKNEKFSDLYPNVQPIKKNNLFDSDLQKPKPQPIPHQTILNKKKVLKESISNENYINANNKTENIWQSSESYHLKNGVAKKTLKHLKSTIFNSEQIFTILQVPIMFKSILLEIFLSCKLIGLDKAAA